MPTIFDNIVGKPWELRYDAALNITYRYNSREEEWEIDGAWTPSSSSFPTTNLKLQEVREDIDTWRKYRWNWSAWVLISLATITSSQIVDWAITEDKLATDSVSTDKIQDDAVTADKIA